MENYRNDNKDFFEELRFNERTEFSALLANWLGAYTDEIIKSVLPRAREIYEDAATMRLLRELRDREQKEREDVADTLRLNLTSENYYSVHLHCLTHAGSYRDILYDLYIKDRPREEE